MRLAMTRRVRAVTGATLLVLLAAWLGLSPRFATGLYEPRLFHPNEGNGSQSDLRAFQDVENHEVFFKAADGTTLHGWIYVNPGSRQILLIHPGNAGDIAGRLQLTKLLLKTGASVFQYEPRGFGLSGGQPTLAGVAEDGLAAYDYLVNVAGYSPDSIVLYGMSLGSGVATYVSEHRRSAGIVIHAGFSSLERIGKEKLPILRIYPAWLFPHPRMDNAGILEGSHPPLLILHGEKDTMIPVAHAEELNRRASRPKELVRFPDSGHWTFDVDDARQFVTTVDRFLSSLP
jgi:hypothetical protein